MRYLLTALVGSLALVVGCDDRIDVRCNGGCPERRQPPCCPQPKVRIDIDPVIIRPAPCPPPYCPPHKEPHR